MMWKMNTCYWQYQLLLTLCMYIKLVLGEAYQVCQDKGTYHNVLESTARDRPRSRWGRFEVVGDAVGCRQTCGRRS